MTRLIEALGTFVQGLADIITVKGPGGSKLATAAHLGPVNPCFYLTDICGDHARR